MFEGNQYTITLSISENNVTKKSQMYTATDIYPGFELNEEFSAQSQDLSMGSNSTQVHILNLLLLITFFLQSIDI